MNEGMGGYIPPLRFHALTPLYDSAVRWTTREAAFRELMLACLADESHGSILDVGCGTGSFAVLATQRYPDARIAGVDADEAALGIAAGKAAGAGARVAFHRADARRLPFDAGSFGAVTASLFFHHLQDRDKRIVLRELRRCLRPGGTLVVSDWHRAGSPAGRLAFLLVRALDGFSVTRAHAEGRFPRFLAEAGFEISRTGVVPAPLGSVGVWRCTRA